MTGQPHFESGLISALDTPEAQRLTTNTLLVAAAAHAAPDFDRAEMGAFDAPDGAYHALSLHSRTNRIGGVSYPTSRSADLEDGEVRFTFPAQQLQMLAIVALLPANGPPTIYKVAVSAAAEEQRPTMPLAPYAKALLKLTKYAATRDGLYIAPHTHLLLDSQESRVAWRADPPETQLKIPNNEAQYISGTITLGGSVQVNSDHGQYYRFDGDIVRGSTGQAAITLPKGFGLSTLAPPDTASVRIENHDLVYLAADGQTEVGRWPVLIGNSPHTTDLHRRIAEALPWKGDVSGALVGRLRHVDGEIGPEYDKGPIRDELIRAVHEAVRSGLEPVALGSGAVNAYLAEHYPPRALAQPSERPADATARTALAHKVA